MTTVWTACGLSLCALAVLTVLRELRKESVPLLNAAVSTAFLALLLPGMLEGVSFVREITVQTGDGSAVGEILRALGVTLLTASAADLCRSAGEAAVGTSVETVGRVEILLLCLPLFRDLVDLALLT